MMKSFTLIASILASAALNATESRTHYNIKLGDDTVLYRVTEIEAVAAFDATTTLLIEDQERERRLILRSTSDYAHGEIRWELLDPISKQMFRAVQAMPFSGKTRIAALEEFREMTDEQRRSFKPAIVLVFGGLELRSEEGAHSTEARTRRTEFRSMTDTAFLEDLERLRLVATHPLVRPFCSAIMTHVLYSESCTTEMTHAEPAEADCNFDAAFGYSCSKKQQEAVQKAMEAGRALKRY
jgi:hypothetical protein